MSHNNTTSRNIKPQLNIPTE